VQLAKLCIPTETEKPEAFQVEPFVYVLMNPPDERRFNEDKHEPPPRDAKDSLKEDTPEN
jgi:hypothetical protein